MPTTNYFEPALPLNVEHDNLSVPPKYVAVVLASQISSFLEYQKKKDLGTNPFLLAANSFLQVDKDIQRGHADEFRQNLAQDKRKIENIANTLLGQTEENHAFLGSLVWNVRPSDGSLDLVIVQKKNMPPISKLEITASRIFLPDSAHRHFGIAEAYRRYCASPEKFPRFNKEMCFSVEIYNLDDSGERELFSELNSKQKKITAARKKTVDSVSPGGRLKSRILTIDNDSDPPLFENNYEETSNQLVNHKLLTMSVFMAAISEMFTKAELDQAKKDDETSTELAAYFCSYFYCLRDTLEITVEVDGKQESISPFYNLYNDHIRPIVENESDEEEGSDLNKKLEQKVSDAKLYATQVRDQDKTNSNPVTRAFARLARTIRRLPNWEGAIKKIQANGFERRGGKLFHVENEELFAREIGKKKADGSLNIQVQTHTIKAAYEYLLELADLDFQIQVDVVKSPDSEIAIGDYTQTIRSDQEVTSVIRVAIFLPKGMPLEQDATYIRVENNRDWKKGFLTTKANRVACDKAKLVDYTHPTYGQDVCRHELLYSIKFPAYNLAEQSGFESKLKIRLPMFDGIMSDHEVSLRCQPE